MQPNLFKLLVTLSRYLADRNTDSADGVMETGRADRGPTTSSYLLLHHCLPFYPSLVLLRPCHRMPFLHCSRSSVSLLHSHHYCAVCSDMTGHPPSAKIVGPPTMEGRFTLLTTRARPFTALSALSALPRPISCSAMSCSARAYAR